MFYTKSQMTYLQLSSWIRNCANDHSDVKYLGSGMAGTRPLTTAKMERGLATAATASARANTCTVPLPLDTASQSQFLDRAMLKMAAGSAPRRSSCGGGGGVEVCQALTHVLGVVAAS